jgi:hypothetical protein
VKWLRKHDRFLWGVGYGWLLLLMFMRIEKGEWGGAVMDFMVGTIFLARGLGGDADERD